MSRTRKRLLAPAAALALGLVLSACGSGGGNGPGNNSGGDKAPGKATNTVTYAMPPNTQASFIWPFSSLKDFSVVNAGNFQQLLYRPLYWFGDDKGGPNLNERLSVGEAPVYTDGGKTVTVKLKPYKWSNGESVTADNVLFWFNMEKAEKANYAGYAPGGFPDNVVSATKQGDDTVVFKLDKAYSQQWFTGNELSQITPMPKAWDKTSATTNGSCSSSVSSCKAVYKFLNGEAKKLSSYASSPIWSVVDGPWKLSTFNADGHVSFVPNPTYSGPAKPKIKKFIEAPFTTDSAEYNVLKSGQTLDVGYIPSTSVNGKAKSATEAGPNPIGDKYKLEPWFLYSVNYFPYNFTNPKTGPIFKQLPVRQAMQSVVDQDGIIKSAAKGYGVPTIGPVPVIPPSNLVSDAEKNNPYPFSIDKAKKYLTDAGWSVKPGGVTTCAKPGSGSGQCGAGVPAGAQLSFNLQYASGNKAIDIAMDDLKSNASKVGIKLNVTQAPFNTVIGKAVPTDHTWDMQNWGGGWAYAPDYYPTGELIFQSGAGSNSGAYNNKTNDANITATTIDSGSGPMHTYADYLAKDLPVVWSPNYTYALTEVAGGLKGFGAQNAFGAVNPEEWHF